MEKGSLHSILLINTKLHLMAVIVMRTSFGDYLSHAKHEKIDIRPSLIK